MMKRAIAMLMAIMLCMTLIACSNQPMTQPNLESSDSVMSETVDTTSGNEYDDSDGKDIATIPLGKFRFTGCICAIMLNGQEYRIATYRGVEIQKWSAQGAVLKQGRYRLEVQLLEQKAQPLRAPSDGDMNRIIHESLCAKVRYCFWRDRELLFDYTANHAGYEYAEMATDP